MGIWWADQGRVEVVGRALAPHGKRGEDYLVPVATFAGVGSLAGVGGGRETEVAAARLRGL